MPIRLIWWRPTALPSPGVAGAFLTSPNITVVGGAGRARLHLISSSATGAGGSTVALLNSASNLSLTNAASNVVQVALDLGGNVQPIADFKINGIDQGSGYFGSAAFFTANPGFADANSADDQYFSGDGALFTSVPEPGTLSLIGIGALGLMRPATQNRLSIKHHPQTLQTTCFFRR